MQHWQIPEEAQTLIMLVLDGQKVRVRMNRIVTADSFCPTAGVLQGDTLSPYLFLLCMDVIFHAMEEEKMAGAVIAKAPAQATGTRSRPRPCVWRKLLYSLGYADDIICTSNSHAGAEALLQATQRAAGTMGLQVNSKKGKTEVMVCGPVERPIQAVRTIEGVAVNQTVEYKYLGWHLTPGGWQADLRLRMGKAWGLWHLYRWVWEAGNPQSVKHMLHSIVIPALSYASLAYPWTKTARMALNTCFFRLLRKTYKITIDYEGLSQAPVESTIPDRPFLSTQLLFAHLKDVGKWCRDHYDGETFHPVIDIMEWDPGDVRKRRGGSKSGPREGLLRKANVASWDEFARLADSEKRWMREVARRAVAEEVDVASQIGSRREKETRRVTAWTRRDTARLIDDRRKVARCWVDAKLSS
jgi:hypothetical protein